MGQHADDEIYKEIHGQYPWESEHNNDYTCEFCGDPVPANTPVYDSEGNVYCSTQCLDERLNERKDVGVVNA